MPLGEKNVFFFSENPLQITRLYPHNTKLNSSVQLSYTDLFWFFPSKLRGSDFSLNLLEQEAKVKKIMP